MRPLRQPPGPSHTHIASGEVVGGHRAVSLHELDGASDGLRVLSTEECEDLLRRNRFGRLALGTAGWPAILPVNYMYEGTSVVIRTAKGAKLNDAPMSAVAFEIDDVDRYGAWGWSVLVQGPAFDITSSNDDLSAHLRQLPVRPWAPGAHDHWLKISAAGVSGRAFGEIEHA